MGDSKEKINTSFISIITPTYNRGNTFLPKTIESIQNQKEKGFEHEHIIVDNGSQDGTEEIVNTYARQDARIHYFNTGENMGPAAALNFGFLQSKGAIILPLDDDDLLPLHSLQMHYSAYTADPRVMWTYGYSLNISETNTLLSLSERIPEYAENAAELFQKLFQCNTITNGCVSIRREAIVEVGGWDVQVKSQDWDMWLKLAHAGYMPQVQERYLSFYRVHSAQLTTTHSQDGTWERDREYLKGRYGL